MRTPAIAVFRAGQFLRTTQLGPAGKALGIVRRPAVPQRDKDRVARVVVGVEPAAMVLGRPIVSTAVGSIPDAVRDVESALLVPPRDADALAGAIRRLLDDADLAARLGAGAHRASMEFSVDTMVERTLAAYASAVEHRQGRPT